MRCFLCNTTNISNIGNCQLLEAYYVASTNTRCINRSGNPPISLRQVLMQFTAEDRRHLLYQQDILVIKSQRSNGSLIWVCVCVHTCTWMNKQSCPGLTGLVPTSPPDKVTSLEFITQNSTLPNTEKGHY